MKFNNSGDCWLTNKDNDNHVGMYHTQVIIYWELGLVDDTQINDRKSVFKILFYQTCTYGVFDGKERNLSKIRFYKTMQKIY